MCDTMVALGNSTKDGTVIFAKNSDRQPNEPLLSVRIPRRTYPKGSKLKCTYITIDQARETYDVMLLKPSWMWGAEMGCNEFGLNIGNEAVFTKIKQGPPGLLGMDLVRLALERCQTSTEALHLIVDLLQKHGQGGNCGYEKDFFYHNSFLIADPTSAWVLETAGPYWAAEKVKDVRAISNRLSIGRDFDLAHPELVDYAISKRWCRSEQDFHFARCYSDKLYSWASGSSERWQAGTDRLEKTKGEITLETMFAIMRSHHPTHERPFNKASLKSVCMHGGSLIGDHCTGSYGASLGEHLHTYWLTGGSTPCISIFKPYWLTKNNILFAEDEKGEALDFWLQRERLHRMVLENRITNLDQYVQKGRELEQEMLARTAAFSAQPPTAEALNEIMAGAWGRERQLVENTIAENEHNRGNIQGSLFFKHYWKKQTEKLFDPAKN